LRNRPNTLGDSDKYYHAHSRNAVDITKNIAPMLEVVVIRLLFVELVSKDNQRLGDGTCNTSRTELLSHHPNHSAHVCVIEK
jgi:hypothetical protein